MPHWTHEQLAEYQARRARIRSSEPKPVEGNTLVGTVPRKAKSRNRAPVSPEPKSRQRIKFTVYAVRPCDWDGYHIKELQDMLIHAGILDSDDWASLRGEVISEKVYSKEEEMTVIEILLD